MGKSFDPRLYLVIGPENCAHYTILEVVRQALEGGITLIQYRDKYSDTDTQVQNVVSLMNVAKEFQVPVLVNDRPDVAKQAEADGVHLGQSDEGVQQARILLGKNAIIGLTVKNESHIKTAPIESLDYLGIGGVCPTESKVNPDAPLGVNGLLEMLKVSRAYGDLPTTAIAGIDESNCDAIAATGVNGLAVVSAICGQVDPKTATQRLRQKIDPFFEKGIAV
ncbi:thiamine phosphate synthase [Curvivirga aplysinae]|uniref:thiamine phosphate synthase n=1 Tax=Curvivirga aplysinae TaxID=2529852 RepID=UPI0012BC71AE|nr:thiamine phosphate synthase [Curvivirga aplysinae]MTI09499.1 thiamine phosphate synthase [Curvivirga aplysinae]